MKKFFSHILILIFCLTAGLGVGETCAQTPVISSFSPERAWYGTDVYIKGSGFTGSKEDLEVRFGAGVGKIIESTATAIRVQVPAGATYGPVTVLYKPSGLKAYSPEPFLLTFGGRNNETPLYGSPQKLPVKTGLKLYDACTCDLDGDSRNDMAGSNPGGLSITTYLNNSTGGSIDFPLTLSSGLAGRKEINAGKASTYISCGDLDGDGKPDLVLTGINSAQEIVFLRNTSTPGTNGSPGIINFATFQPFPVASKDWQKPQIHDLDGDGKPEIILSNASDNQVYVLKNTSVKGTVSFDAAFIVITLPGNSKRGLRIKDLNKDGLPDISVSDFYGSKVYSMLNNSSAGNISFAAATEFRANSGLTGHELEDIDGDGKPDLITLDYISDPAKVNIYLNNSSGTTLSFAAAASFPTSGNLPFSLELGDLNGDQKADILVGLNGTSVANIFTNTSSPGNLSFTVTRLNSPENGKFSNVQISDFDGDAKPDVVTADNGTNSFFVFRNTSCIAPVINQTPNGENTSLFTVQAPPLPNGTPALSYQWYKDGTGLGNDYKTEDITPGSYTVEIVTENCGTLRSAPYTLNNCQSDLGNPGFDPIPQTCEGSSFTLSVSPAVAGATYKWKNNNSGISQTTTENKLTITGADPELHGGTYTLIIEGSCSLNLQSEVVNILPKPVSSIITNGELTVCKGESADLRAEDGFTAYQWKKDGLAIPSAISSTYTATESGSYSVVVKNAEGCEGETDAITFTVTESVEAGFESPAATCVNQPVQFIPNFTLPQGMEASYSWDFGDGTISFEKSPVHSYKEASLNPYTVTLTLQYGPGNCLSTSGKTIKVSNLSGIDIEALSPNFCDGDSVKVQVKGDILAVKWSNGGTGLFTYAKKGGSLQADITTVGGCTTSKSVELNTIPKPVPEISADKVIAGIGEAVRLQAGGGVAYLWEPAENIDNPEIANPVVFPKKNTTYRVTVAGENGCTSVAEITIEVESSFRVTTPKLFVPATDQYWKVGNIENFQDISVTILNKFGRTIFESLPYKNDWDGTEKGNNLPDGVYYFVFKDDSGNVIKTGSITMIR